jgi:AcrR family transcriptional regulator
MNERASRKAASHQHIVDVASRALRRQGFHGVNVTEVMRAAGMTHGGFYGHFQSRDALLSEAVAEAGTQNLEILQGQVDRSGALGVGPFRALIETYLSEGHVQDWESACPVSLLGSEMPRQVSAVVEPSRGVIGNLHRLVKEVLPRGAEPDAAWTVTGALVGAVQLTRALGDDPAASAALADVKSNLLARYDV